MLSVYFRSQHFSVFHGYKLYSVLLLFWSTFSTRICLVLCRTVETLFLSVITFWLGCLSSPSKILLSTRKLLLSRQQLTSYSFLQEALKQFCVKPYSSVSSNYFILKLCFWIFQNLLYGLYSIFASRHIIQKWSSLVYLILFKFTLCHFKMSKYLRLKWQICLCHFSSTGSLYDIIIIIDLLL